LTESLIYVKINSSDNSLSLKVGKFSRMGECVFSGGLKLNLSDIENSLYPERKVAVRDELSTVLSFFTYPFIVNWFDQIHFMAYPCEIQVSLIADS